MWGVLLAKRVDLCCVWEVYRLGNFFVELCYDKITGKPTCICSFTRSQRLMHYEKELRLYALTPSNDPEYN